MKRRCDEDKAVQAVVKAIKVFEALEGSHFEPVSVKQIVKRCEIHRNMVMDYLATFQGMGWARQDETTKKWTVGRSMLRLSTAIVRSQKEV